jgi:hypothetical protein
MYMYLHIAGKFLYGANFRIFHMPIPYAKIKTTEFYVTFDLHVYATHIRTLRQRQQSKYSCRHGSLSPSPQSKGCHVSLGTWKAIGCGLAIVTSYTSCACTQSPTASIQNLKIRKFILKGLWSIVRRLAPTKISHYLVHVCACTYNYILCVSYMYMYT